MRLFFALIATIGLYANASSQYPILSGKVSNYLGSPLNGVVVLVKSTAQADTTDANGEYQILVSNVVGVREMNPGINPAAFMKGRTLYLTMDVRNHLSVSLVNFSGHLVAKVADGQFNSGVHPFDLPMENLKAGVYLLRISVSGESKVLKLFHYPPLSNSIAGSNQVSYSLHKAGAAADTVTFSKSGYITLKKDMDSASGTLNVKMSPTNSKDYKFLTHNPLDLKQVEKISKFRSCVGHEYTGSTNPADQGPGGQHERGSSMKHYIEGVASTHGTSVSKNPDMAIKIFAPFKGRVACITPDDRGKKIILVPDEVGGWDFILFHADVKTSMAKGSTFNGGDHIGFGNLDPSTNFDFGIKGHLNDSGTFSPYNDIECDSTGKYDQLIDMKNYGVRMSDSFLHHLVPSVMNEYTSRGFSANNWIISKADRDAAIASGAVCKYDSDAHGNAANWVILQ